MMHITRVKPATAVLAALLLSLPAPLLAQPPQMQVYKTPTCGCCVKWIDHVKAGGYEVVATDVTDLVPVKRELGVPMRTASCHTAVIGGYVIEGHVPVDDISRLLAERPADVLVLAVPRMPIGSPGMEGPNPERYETLAVKKDGKLEVFAVHAP
jgi:hypothetical protein